MDEDEWLSCDDPVAMLKFIWQDASERKVRLYLCAGCRHVAHLFYLPESLAAVEVAERFADGMASDEELGKADWAAEVPTICFDLERAPPPQNPRRAEIIAGLIEKGAVPESVLHGGEWQVDEGAATRLDAAAELAWHCVLPLRDDHVLEFFPKVDWPGHWLFDCVFGNPFSPPSPVATSVLAWEDGTVVRLAQAADQARVLPAGHLDSQRLAVLADALEEAGCSDAILSHLRSPGPHVRGCWAIDLLLNRS